MIPALMPDIYFIVPDGYPSDAWLQSKMNFDNSAFTEALQGARFRRRPSRAEQLRRYVISIVWQRYC